MIHSILMHVPTPHSKPHTNHTRTSYYYILLAFLTPFVLVPLGIFLYTHFSFFNETIGTPFANFVAALPFYLFALYAPAFYYATSGFVSETKSKLLENKGDLDYLPYAAGIISLFLPLSKSYIFLFSVIYGTLSVLFLLYKGFQFVYRLFIRHEHLAIEVSFFRLLPFAIIGLATFLEVTLFAIVFTYFSFQ